MKKVFIYSFANTSYFFNEVIKLSNINNDNIEWGVIYSRANYKESSNGLVKKENIFYLYENFSNDYKIDIKLQDMQFNTKFQNIHRIIESSKIGYKLEKSSYRQIKVAYIVYITFKTFLTKNRPQYIIFPDIEEVNGLILYNVAIELGIETLCYVQNRQLNGGFFAQDYMETLPSFFNKITEKDLIKAKNFLSNKIKKGLVHTDIEKQPISIKAPSIFIRLYRNVLNHFKYEKYMIKNNHFMMRIRVNLTSFLRIKRRWFFDNFQCRFFDIKKDVDFLELPENYIYFPLQVTPESSINTFEQYFIEQIRAIELIRLNMPNNFFIIVKEHPAQKGLRENSFYKELKRKSGVLLCSPYVDSHTLIKQSKLVTSITGTAGLESYLMDKPAVLFANTFFSHLVYRFDSFLNFDKLLYKAIYEYTPHSQDRKVNEIAKIFNISYDIFLHEPFHFSKVMDRENIDNFLFGLKDHITRLENYKKEQLEFSE